MYNQVLGIIREFNTADFRVIVDAIEDYDMDLSWDDTGEALAKLQSGELIGFTARCRVIHSKLGEIGSDYLGGCIYSNLDDFQNHRECAKETRKLNAEGSKAICGSYFSDMISAAISEARENIEEMQFLASKIRVRS